MKIEDYQKLSQRTCASLGTFEKDMEHMDIGIVTEIGECMDIFKKKLAYKKDIDVVHLGEELADIAWYVANKSTIAEIVLSSEQLESAYDTYFAHGVEMTTTEEDIRMFSQGLLLAIVGPLLGQTNIFSSPIVVFAGLKAICNLYKLDLGTQLEKNINKLKIRYPEKFDIEKALVRDLASERKSLEE